MSYRAVVKVSEGASDEEQRRQLRIGLYDVLEELLLAGDDPDELQSYCEQSIDSAIEANA